MGNNVDVTLTVSENGKKSPNWNLETDLNGDLTSQDFLSFLKNVLITTAKTAHAEELARGFDKQATVFVDKVPKKPIEGVTPFGRIQYVARADATEMMLYIYNMIMQKSPILKGNYINSNVVYHNGQLVAKDLDQLKRFLDKTELLSKDTVRFVNLQPYARKLERHGIYRGKKAPKNGDGKKRQKKNRGFANAGDLIPNGVYVLTKRLAKFIYGKNSFIEFEFVEGGSLPGMSEATYKKKSGKKSRIGKTYFYPSIRVKIIEAGLTQNGK